MSTFSRQRLYNRYEAHAPDAGSDRAPYLRYLVSDHFPSSRSARVLDLGCGDGALLRAATDVGYRDVRGVDAAQGMVERAHRVGSHFVELGDIFDALADTPDGACDLVIAFDVLEHLERDEQLRLLDESFRVLALDGRLLIHVPNGESPFVGSVLFGDATHVTAFTVTSLNQLFLAAGFRRVECVEDRPVVHGLKSGVRRVLWEVLRLVLRGMTAVETGSSGGGAVLTRNVLAVAFK